MEVSMSTAMTPSKDQMMTRKEIHRTMRILNHTTTVTKINQAVIRRAIILKAILKTALILIAITPKAEREAIETKSKGERNLVEKPNQAGIADMIGPTIISIRTSFCCNRDNFYSNNSFCCKWPSCLSNNFCFSNSWRCSSKCSCNHKCHSSALQISAMASCRILPWFKMLQ